MDRLEYKRRITALGFSQGSWSRYVELDKATVSKQCRVEIKIKGIYWRVIEWLEAGQLRNPNK